MWLVRIPIIPGPSICCDGKTKWWTAERKFTMESEIATMRYIAESTNIPVPTVFGHRAYIEGNPVKLPYMLMECIRGNMLFDLGGPEILTADQRRKIRKSIASIQVCGAECLPISYPCSLPVSYILVSNGDCLDQQAWIPCLGAERDN